MFSRPIKNRIGVISIIFLTIFPVAIWLLMKPLGDRFANSFFALSSVGQIAGLLGMILFALTLILSARLKFLEDYFGGLNKVYNIHHISGVVAFILLLVHPLTLSIRLIPISVIEAAKFLIPGGDWAVNFGILSLLLMMLLLVVTFFSMKMRYQNLKMIHKILGITFFVGALHSFLIPSDISQNMVLRFYILGFAGLAILTYLYRSIFGGLMVNKFNYLVEAVNLKNEGVVEIVMSPEGERMNYLPGQFLFVSFIDGGISKEVHPFSISSAPMEEALRITVKSLGDWTTELKNLNVGSTAKIEGPFGEFSYLKGKSKNQIWIAGGIGVTPFLNMLRNLRINRRDDMNIDFYYTTKAGNEMVFTDEIEDITRECSNIRFIPHASNEIGHLSADAIKNISGDMTGKEVFMCGPLPMMNSLRNQFSRVGIHSDMIHTEEFKLL